MLLSLVVVCSFLAGISPSFATPYNPPQYCRRDACYNQAQSSQSQCSSYLQKTVTLGAQTRTVTSTLSTTIAITQTETTIIPTTSVHATTETDTTTTIRTEIDSETVTNTAVTTEVSVSIVTQSSTATAPTVTIGSPAGRKAKRHNAGNKPNRRGPAAPATTTAKKEPTRPPCPEACPNTSSFISACSCLGVQPKTVTSTGPTTTVFKTVTATATETKQATNTIISTVSADSTATVTSTATNVQTNSVTATVLTTATSSSTMIITTTAITTTTPSCRPTTTSTMLIVNGNFDSNWKNPSTDAPWQLTGSTEFANDPAHAQSPPIVAHIPISNGGNGGTVSQTITGYTPGSKLVVSTFFRPFNLNPQPSDTTVDQKCTFIISFGSTALFTRSYTAQNGTQSGYSFVQFNQVDAPAADSAPLTIGYTCPPGYIGAGNANFYIDTVSVRGNNVVCNPVVVGPTTD